jgi:hypothetical protein
MFARFTFDYADAFPGKSDFDSSPEALTRWVANANNLACFAASSIPNPARIAKQENSSDCGVFVIVTAEAVAMGNTVRTPPLSQPYRVSVNACKEHACVPVQPLPVSVCLRACVCVYVVDAPHSSWTSTRLIQLTFDVASTSPLWQRP